MYIPTVLNFLAEIVNGALKVLHVHVHNVPSSVLY